MALFVFLSEAKKNKQSFALPSDLCGFRTLGATCSPLHHFNFMYRIENQGQFASPPSSRRGRGIMHCCHPLNERAVGDDFQVGGGDFERGGAQVVDEDLQLGVPIGVAVDDAL